MLPWEEQCQAIPKLPLCLHAFYLWFKHEQSSHPNVLSVLIFLVHLRRGPSLVEAACRDWSDGLLLSLGFSFYYCSDSSRLDEGPYLQSTCCVVHRSGSLHFPSLRFLCTSARCAQALFRCDNISHYLCHKIKACDFLSDLSEIGSLFGEPVVRFHRPYSMHLKSLPSSLSLAETDGLLFRAGYCGLIKE